MQTGDVECDGIQKPGKKEETKIKEDRTELISVTK